MLDQISQEIKQTILNYNSEDSLIFKTRIIPLSKEHFSPIIEQNNKTIAFIDGGQAEILAAGNFCLSFIRVYAQVFSNNQKMSSYKNEFYLFTKAEYLNNELYYKSKIYSENKIINEDDLTISSMDSSIRTGQERAPISKITNMARRFAELSLAKQVATDFVILDGTLETTYKNEENYLQGNFSALAKSSTLFTTLGNSPVVLLKKIGPLGCWNYQVDELTSFVKLHPHAKYVFRFEGNKEVLPYLIQNSKDALFLGYPYGLLHVDRMARVSNMEKQSLMMRFLLKAENKEISDYLQTLNAHSILDSIS